MALIHELQRHHPSIHQLLADYIQCNYDSSFDSLGRLFDPCGMGLSASGACFARLSLDNAGRWIRAHRLVQGCVSLRAVSGLLYAFETYPIASGESVVLNQIPSLTAAHRAGNGSRAI